MASIAIEGAGPAPAGLPARVDGRETVIVTRNGRPVLDLAPHRRRAGFGHEAGEADLHFTGIVRRPGFIASDLDDSLPEGFLITPLPGS